MESTGTTIGALSPTHGGNIFKLPREIRDQIYRNLFRQTFLVYGKQFWDSDRIGNTLPEGKLDIAILLCCKVISEEATPVFYDNAIFRFALSFDYKKPAPGLPSHITDRMMNVDVVVDVAGWGDAMRNGSFCEYKHPYHMQWWSQHVVKAFTGTNVKRKTCGIKFWGLEFRWEELIDGSLDGSLGQEIRFLTGFDLVIVEVEDINFSIYYGREGDVEDMLFGFTFGREGDEEESEDDSSPKPELDDSPQSEGSEDDNSSYPENDNFPQPEDSEDLDYITRACFMCIKSLKATLEPTLGPTEIMDFSCLPNSPEAATGLIMVFQPPAHLGQTIRKKGRKGKKVIS